MNLTPWKSSNAMPFRNRINDEMSSFQREMNNLVSTFFNRGDISMPTMMSTGTYYPSIDLKEKDNKYLLDADLPGMNEADIDRIIKERKSSKQPILMSDALSANDKSDFEFLRSYCLAHGRRKFYDLDKKFTEASEFVIEKIAVVYKNDKHCKENNLTALARMKYHQEHSQRSMDELNAWCENIIQNKEVEPNSILSTEIMYLLNHWDGPTSFLSIESAELDNNQLEQKLRLSVLNRKNWLFYKSEPCALIGDIICSMIKTCEALTLILLIILSG